MAARRPFGAQVIGRLTRLAPRIKRAEARVDELYAQRAQAFADGRSTNPATGRAYATFPELAQAAGCSEEAVHKALRRHAPNG